MATRALARGWRLAESWRLSSTARCPIDRRGLSEYAIVATRRRCRDAARPSRSATRVALWHSLARIEFVAIDLALDMAGRFGAERGPAFVGDFLSVAADETMHFALLARKLESLGSHYGALPAHDGLWESAHATRQDCAARLAVVPMMLEARGLDVTPAMLERVRGAGDEHGARDPRTDP